MWGNYFALSAPSAWPSGNAPLDPATTPFAVLVEALGGDPEGDPARFDRALEAAYTAGLASDAAVARSESEAASLWRVRDNVECLEALQPYVIFDVSTGIGDMPGYLAEVSGRLAARWPGYRMAVFGHLGDGNLHLVVTAGDPDPAVREAIKDCVYEPLAARRGSVSAEHGVGLARLRHLPISRNAAELALMRTLKQALDPRGILNPGKVLPGVRV
jgi:FAD/FMN-containing dehydrogenase